MTSTAAGSYDDARSGPSRADIDLLLGHRVASGAGPVLTERTATVLFDLGRTGRWTLHLHRGRLGVQRGATPAPTTHIRTDAATLAAVLDGKESGAAAFLDGRLTVRGDLSLGLQLDGVFTADRPLSHPRAGVVSPLGVRTSYLEAGDPAAPPVMLLHGLGATNASLLPLLTGLADRYRVLAPDLVGFGETSAPRWRYTAADFADWYVAFCRAVGVRRAPVVGNSLGGRVALEAALVAPELVDRLVLLCPSPALRKLRQFVPVVRILTPDLARLRLPMTHGMVVSGIKVMFADPHRLPDTWYAAGADEFLRVMRRWSHRRAFFAALRQIYMEEPHGDRGFWTRLGTITAPALFLWGDSDVLVPSSYARHVITALPDAQSVILSNCGHVPQFELPERTLQLTSDFLSA